MGMPWPPDPATNRTRQQNAYVSCLAFLREELCVRRNKQVIFRTWDTYPDRFHANPEYYLAVTNRIEPHKNLVFSIKHTAIDYWHRVRFNPTLGIGKHPQAVENDVMRNYDGNGAFPHYTGAGIVDGAFPEYDGYPELQRGLKDLVHPTSNSTSSSSSSSSAVLVGYSGGFDTYSRGTPGPNLYGSGLWPDLNMWIPLEYLARNGTMSEPKLFEEYCLQRLGLSQAGANLLRSLALNATKAVLLGRYVEAFDLPVLNFSYMPSGNWMEMDRMAGLNNLANPLWNHKNYPHGDSVFSYLYKHDLFPTALAEKERAGVLWGRVAAIFSTMEANNLFPSTPAGERLYRRLYAQVRYGQLLFRIGAAGWTAMAWGYHGDQEGKHYNLTAVCGGIDRYDRAFHAFTAFTSNHNWSPAPFQDYWLGDNVRGGNGNLEAHPPGIGASVDQYRYLCSGTGTTNYFEM